MLSTLTEGQPERVLFLDPCTGTREDALELAAAGAHMEDHEGDLHEAAIVVQNQWRGRKLSAVEKIFAGTGGQWAKSEEGSKFLRALEDSGQRVLAWRKRRMIQETELKELEMTEQTERRRLEEEEGVVGRTQVLASDELVGQVLGGEVVSDEDNGVGRGSERGPGPAGRAEPGLSRLVRVVRDRLKYFEEEFVPEPQSKKIPTREVSFGFGEAEKLGEGTGSSSSRGGKTGAPAALNTPKSSSTLANHLRRAMLLAGNIPDLEQLERQLRAAKRERGKAERDRFSDRDAWEQALARMKKLEVQRAMRRAAPPQQETTGMVRRGGPASPPG